MTLQLTRQLHLSSTIVPGELRLVVRRGNTLAQEEAFAPDATVNFFERPGTAKTSWLVLPIEEFGTFRPLS